LTGAVPRQRVSYRAPVAEQESLVAGPQIRLRCMPEFGDHFFWNIGEHRAINSMAASRCLSKVNCGGLLEVNSPIRQLAAICTSVAPRNSTQGYIN
jgi:hypothetical protein